MRRYRSPHGARFGLVAGLTGAAIFALLSAPPLGALQSAAGPLAGQTAGSTAPAPADSRPAAVADVSAAEPQWWRLVGTYIDEAPQLLADGRSYQPHALDLMIPAGWRLVGQVDWPNHKGTPSLAFLVDSPDGQISLEYLPSESWNWSKDPDTRASLQATGKRVQTLPPTLAADYLRSVLLPSLRPGAQVIAIEPLPKITGYLNQELIAQNTVDKVDAEQTGTAVPKSSGDAARARITYLRNGAPLEEWIEIAVEHLQKHADNTPPWGPGETSRVYVAPSGPMIDTFTVLECDILRAPQGTLDRNSLILGSILAHLRQDDAWTQQVSYEYWHGKFNDEVIYFRSSYFGEDRFDFDDPSGRGYDSFAYPQAWSSAASGEFVVTDSADFNPNGRVDAQKWIQLKPHVDP